VTRWKWRKKLSDRDSFANPLTLDSKGRIFVATRELGSDPAGWLIAVKPDGPEIYRTAEYGAFSAHLVASDKLYAAATSVASGGIRQIDPDTGIRIRSACEASLRGFRKWMFLVDEGTPQQRVVVLSSNNELMAARPGVASGPTCIEILAALQNDFAVTSESALLTQGESFLEFPWLGDNWGTAVTLAFPFSPAEVVKFPTSSGRFRLVGIGNSIGQASSFFIQNDDAGYTSVPIVGISGSLSDLTIGGTHAQPFFLVALDDWLLKAGFAPDDPSQLKLIQHMKFSSAVPELSSFVLGSGRLIYRSGADGRVDVYSADELRVISQTQLVENPSAGVTLTLDVSRHPDGTKDCTKPGVLYVLETTGRNLYAFIVDSKGIDAEAPWPKYQHDPRNTGNAKTSLKDFSCP
jgi:hypothetical protein